MCTNQDWITISRQWGIKYSFPRALRLKIVNSLLIYMQYMQERPRHEVMYTREYICSWYAHWIVYHRRLHINTFIFEYYM